MDFRFLSRQSASSTPPLFDGLQIGRESWCFVGTCDLFNLYFNYAVFLLCFVFVQPLGNAVPQAMQEVLQQLP